jgi:hypothetical protein
MENGDIIEAKVLDSWQRSMSLLLANSLERDEILEVSIANA